MDPRLVSSKNSKKSSPIWQISPNLLPGMIDGWRDQNERKTSRFFCSIMNTRIIRFSRGKPSSVFGHPDSRHGRCLPASYKTGLHRHRRTQARVNKASAPCSETGRAEKRNLKGAFEPQENFRYPSDESKRKRLFLMSHSVNTLATVNNKSHPRDSLKNRFSTAICLETKGVAVVDAVRNFRLRILQSQCFFS